MSRLIVLVLLLCTSIVVNSFGLTSRGKLVSRYYTMEFDSNESSYQDLKTFIKSNQFSKAYKLLKRNPLLQINKDDAKAMLNNINDLTTDEGRDPQIELQERADASVFLYRRLKRQNVLCGFDCIKDQYPENVIEVSPQTLENRSGLSMTSLTPKQRTNYWRLAGLLLCTSEFIIGDAIGVDPIYTLIPATMLLLLSDQLFYKGAFFETIYRTLFPEYSKKIICHEAGHFLVAYLLGIPVRGCITNAWEALKYPDIAGQAGTIFYDAKMADEVAQQKLTRTSLDRLSVVTMAGIAAEALRFGNSEGGMSDEQSLISLFSQLSPPWNILRVQGQARWAVLQAISLIKEHQSAYDAVVQALEQGKGVGDVVMAIEDNLPQELPASKRVAARTERKKKIERDALVRYVQKMTWNVGGVSEELSESKEDSDGPSQTNERSVLKEQQSLMDERTSAVEEFADKMKMLERAVNSGDIPIDELERNSSGGPHAGTPSNPSGGGGLWLNGLDAFKRGSAEQLEPLSNSEVSSTGEDKTDIPDDNLSKGLEKLFGKRSGVVVPPPKDGYEAAVEALAQAEGKIPSDDSTEVEKSSSVAYSSDLPLFARTSQPSKENLVDSSNKDSSDGSRAVLLSDGVRGLLKEHRGYQMKLLEMLEEAQKRQMELSSQRIHDIENELKSLATKQKMTNAQQL